MGRGAQAAVKSVTKLLIDTPACFVLKIVWVVMLVLALDCLRGCFAAASANTTKDSTSALLGGNLDLAQAKEGFLVFAINLVAMPSLLVIHRLSEECAKLEKDREVMKKQAQQAGDFA